MRFCYVMFAVAAVALSACGKKEDAGAVAVPDAGPKKVSVEAPSDAPPPPPPPIVATPDAPADGAPPPDPNEGNWWARKAMGEKKEIMEGWLHQYQTANKENKTAILKDIKNVKLSAADIAMLEALRKQFNYPPIPLQ